jgi:very-short-patch-repair endonuclease
MDRVSTNIHDAKGTIGRERSKRVFQFLRALNEQRNPIILQLTEQPWRLHLDDLPAHEAISYQKPDDQRPGAPFELNISRVDVAEPPPPPAILSDWIEGDWEDVDSEVIIRDKRIQNAGEEDEEEVRFDDDRERVPSYDAWMTKRAKWIASARARQLFDQLYELSGRLEIEGEQYELLLANGMLDWSIGEGHISHPVLFRRVVLSFDPEIPQFSIRVVDDTSTLYGGLFRMLPDICGKAVAQLRALLEEENLHPLGLEDTTEFLKRIVHTLSSQGRYEGRGEMTGKTAYPRMTRRPVIFLRKRAQKFAAAIDGVIEEIEAGAEIPQALLDIVGVPRENGTVPNVDEGASSDILLSKPANREQLRIATHLNQHGAVVVQGPPGTGKTHTIANLVGHLLAESKSILIASHTSKALRRVREQIVEPLRSLCVSVLGGEEQSKDELETAIARIVNRLSAHDPSELRREASHLASERERLTRELNEAKDELSSVIAREHQVLAVGGRSFHPSEAAQKIKREQAEHSWIPDRLSDEAALPLTPSEVDELYTLNQGVSKEERDLLTSHLPADELIPMPSEVEDRLRQLHDMLDRGAAHEAAYWVSGVDRPKAALSGLRCDIKEAMKIVSEASSWQVMALEAGRRGPARKRVWTELSNMIAATCAMADSAAPELFDRAPALSPDLSLQHQLDVLREILKHVGTNGQLGWLASFLRPDWKKYIALWRVHGRGPYSADDFRALAQRAELDLRREQLVARWQQLITRHGGLSLDASEEEPERPLDQYRSQIEAYANWYGDRWMPLLKRMRSLGLKWQAVKEHIPPVSGKTGGLKRLREAMDLAAEVVASEIDFQSLRTIERWFERNESLLADFAETPGSDVFARLHESMQANDLTAYKIAYADYQRFRGKRRRAVRQVELLNKLAAVAPIWARDVRERVAPHDDCTPPGDPQKAWFWRQLYHELEQFADNETVDLQQRIDRIKQELRETTKQLIEKRAWAAQIEKVLADPSKRQALVGWADTQRKIGKGYGKNVPKLRRKARKQMKRCRDAVPVWVTTLAGAIENFGSRSKMFDVLIVDEASQVDVMGFVLLYMAKQVVIVGDHEQVSPSAVGEKIEEVNHLMEEHLQGVPNNHLYDGKTSIYDLARQSLGGTIGLREHFRCVPDIIHFSNALSYDFEIQPLREASDVHPAPHVVEHRVVGASCEDKLNEAEARHVASLVVAMSGHEAYQEKTIGVISLVGTCQAERVDALLRKHLDPVAYEKKHRIMTGSPAQFQGDERDIVLLSMVDAPETEDEVLTRRTRRLFKQRFNVAASRARDQMWVVHSLDPEVNLREGDLRKRLITHARDPSALVRRARGSTSSEHSLLVRQVAKLLRQKGFSATTAWEVGAYTIDLVVEGRDGARLGVICEGASKASVESRQEALERQAILERLGWSFARVRGSVFFRDLERAMRSVQQRLDVMGIAPANATSSSPRSLLPPDNVVAEITRRAEDIRSGWQNA